MTDRQRAAVDLIGRSAIARGVARLSGRLESAATRARAFQAATAITGGWRAMQRSDRRRALGLMLITAALVHSVLTAANHLPAGWMWLVAPAIAFAEGVVLIAASGARAADPS